MRFKLDWRIGQARTVLNSAFGHMFFFFLSFSAVASQVAKEVSCGVVDVDCRNPWCTSYTSIEVLCREQKLSRQWDSRRLSECLPDEHGLNHVTELPWGCRRDSADILLMRGKVGRQECEMLKLCVNLFQAMAHLRIHCLQFCIVVLHFLVFRPIDHSAFGSIRCAANVTQKSCRKDFKAYACSFCLSQTPPPPPLLPLSFSVPLPHSHLPFSQSLCTNSEAGVLKMWYFSLTFKRAPNIARRHCHDT